MQYKQNEKPKYSKEQMKVIRSHIMKQNADFQEAIS